MSDCLRGMQFNIDIWYATVHTIRLQFQRESSTSVCNDIILMWITRRLINNYNGWTVNITMVFIIIPAKISILQNTNYLSSY